MIHNKLYDWQQIKRVQIVELCSLLPVHASLFFIFSQTDDEYFSEYLSTCTLENQTRDERKNVQSSLL